MHCLQYHFTIAMNEMVDSGPVESSARWTSALQVLRTRLFEMAVLLWSLPFGIAILTVFKVVRPPALVRRALRLWSSGFILAAHRLVGVRYRLEGLEHLPPGPVIFVSNHQSYWESIAFTAFVPDINVVSKAEAMNIPVFGWGLRHAPMTPVYRTRRGTNLRRIARDVAQGLAAGRSVLIFPEGTRVKPGSTRPYQRGLELLYRTSGVPVVPVAHNAGLCWTDGFQVKRAGEVVMRFFPAVQPGRDAAVVVREVESLLNREKEVLRQRAAPADAHPRTLAPRSIQRRTEWG